MANSHAIKLLKFAGSALLFAVSLTSLVWLNLCHAHGVPADMGNNMINDLFQGLSALGLGLSSLSLGLQVQGIAGAGGGMALPTAVSNLFGGGAASTVATYAPAAGEFAAAGGYVGLCVGAFLAGFYVGCAIGDYIYGTGPSAPSGSSGSGGFAPGGGGATGFTDGYGTGYGGGGWTPPANAEQNVFDTLKSL